MSDVEGAQKQAERMMVMRWTVDDGDVAFWQAYDGSYGYGYGGLYRRCRRASAVSGDIENAANGQNDNSVRARW